MTSKSSFWKLSIWNFKKRLWSFALCAAIWFVLLPITVFLQTGSYLEGYSAEMLAKNIDWIQALIVNSNIVGSGRYAFISIGMAMLLALHGFGWNNHQNKVDLFQSVPVKASMRFWYIHLNSLWIFSISFGVNMLLANAAAAVQGIWYGGFFKASALSFFMYLLLFLAAYFLMVIAQSLTGNVVLGLFGGAFLLLVEPICYLLRNELMGIFYKTYMENVIMDMYQMIAKGVFSPLAPFVGMYKTISMRNYGFARSTNFSGIGNYILLLLIQIIIYGIIAYFLYKKRPAQTGGKMMIFPKTKPVIKCMIMICGSLLAGIVIVALGGKSTLGYGLTGIILGLIACQVILQTIMEGDFKESLQGKISFGVAAVITIAIYLVFALDITGFDTYLPEKEQVESFALVRSGDYCYDFVDEDGNYQSSTEYLLEHMEITDENVKTQLLDMLGQAIETGEYYVKDMDIDETEDLSDEEEEENEQDWIYVKMRLAGGKEVLREYCLNQKTIRAYWKNLYELPEYKEAIYAILQEGTGEKLLAQKNKSMVTYTAYTMGNRSETAKDTVMIEKLFDAMKTDAAARTADTIMQEIPIGSLYFSAYETVLGTVKVDFHMPIYAEDQATIRVLKEEGWYQEPGVNKEDIAAVTIEKSDGKELVIDTENPLFDEVVDDLVSYDALEYVSDYSLLVKQNYWADITIQTGSGNSDYNYQYNCRLSSEKFPEALKTAFAEMQSDTDYE